MRDYFQRFARGTANAVGSPWAFLTALAITVLWAVAGPIFRYSDSWQLVINTSTTIATFLIVFLIQNTQNHDSHVVQLKLNELIRALDTARTELVNMESLTDDQLNELQKEFENLQTRASRGLERIEQSRKQKAHHQEGRNKRHQSTSELYQRSTT